MKIKTISHNLYLTLFFITLFSLTGCGNSSSNGSSTQSVSGVAMDGYLDKAKVCIDVNQNGICDDNEPNAVTSQGAFTINNVPTEYLNDNYQILVETIPGVTVDLDDNSTIQVRRVMKNVASEYQIITPFTTLVANEVSQGASKIAAKADIANQYGIAVSDLSQDYIAADNTFMRYTAKDIYSQIVPVDAPTYASLYGSSAVDRVNDKYELDNYFAMLQLQGSAQPLNPETMQQIELGAIIDAANSRYINLPVLNFGALDNDGYLESKPYSGNESTISLASSSDASKSNSSLDIKTGGSIKYGGFSAQVGYAQHNQYENTSSSGSGYLTMTKASTGGYAQILTSNFKTYNAMSSYLRGSKLNDAALSQYVNKAIKNGLIKGVTIKSFEPYTPENAYQIIQILNASINVFDALKSQYASKKDKDTLALMIYVKKSANDQITKFYDYFGNEFVSKINLKGYAYGSGKMSVGSASGNEQNQYAATMTMSYSALVAGGSVSADFGYAYGHGWANSFKNINVSAKAQPDTYADSYSWATAIMSMLDKETAKLSVPEMKDAKPLEAKAPPLIEPKKDPNKPPASCFNSYADWKAYRDDTQKADAGGQVGDAKNKVANNAIGDIIGGLKLPDNFIPDPNVLQSTIDNEMAKIQLSANNLSAKAKFKIYLAATSSAQAGNVHYTVNNAIVSGIETTPYSAVIPELTAKLDIPSQNIDAMQFKNISLLLVIAEKLGRLDSYLAFQKAYAVSNVGADMSSAYHNFFTTINNDVFDKLSKSFLTSKDISDAELKGYLLFVFGTSGNFTNSSLYKNLNNTDRYNYIINMLNPQYAQIWSNAKSGFMPINYDSSGKKYFTQATGNAKFINDNPPYQTFDAINSEYSSSNKNPLEFFSNSGVSPLFPLFIFNGKNAPQLIFVQNQSKIILYYTPVGIFASEGASKAFSFNINFDTPVQNITQSNYDNDYKYIQSGCKQFFPKSKLCSQSGFNVSDTSWNYSIDFPNETMDDNMLQKFRVLTINQDYFYGKGQYNNWAQNTPLFRMLFEPTGYPFPYQTLIDINSKNKTRFDLYSSKIVLLPLSGGTYSTSAIERQAFTTNQEVPTDQIAQNKSIDVSKEKAMFINR